ncbi:MAG: hypothetical protein COX80_01580 [Candidatus Magasanikbacteria bacterium CG_4_10_14_0_2_um_filter_33_14]|uniref:Uncharacterized protein n=1 Tax=Candidatus Magasanikbacteria bacterium CG_4_10_14_0_2_um_filter_33_14 TaxID=1974636 RepID=A0A2M7VBP7_9BACT|nr:MAG: hypothetical protein COX80_01580 [Candidatus Magasanikbacteria bacterium CG_4_10_14_0_2_um_filter_33_14]
MKKTFVILPILLILIGAGCTNNQQDIIEQQQKQIEDLNKKIDEVVLTKNNNSVTTTVIEDATAAEDQTKEQFIIREVVVPPKDNFIIKEEIQKVESEIIKKTEKTTEETLKNESNINVVEKDVEVELKTKLCDDKNEKETLKITTEKIYLLLTNLIKLSYEGLDAGVDSKFNYNVLFSRKSTVDNYVNQLTNLSNEIPNTLLNGESLTVAKNNLQISINKLRENFNLNLKAYELLKEDIENTPEALKLMKQAQEEMNLYKDYSTKFKSSIDTALNIECNNVVK